MCPGDVTNAVMITLVECLQMVTFNLGNQEGLLSPFFVSKTGKIFISFKLLFLDSQYHKAPWCDGEVDYGDA